jgi:hypothetical protein
VLAETPTNAALAAGVALSAGAEKPTMEVLPSPTGLKYGQSVTIKAHNLPKGSGSVAASFWVLLVAAGMKIASPTANDCAGAAELGTLVVLKSWQSNGEFETKYTLPTSGQRFGENKRFCDKTHHCALVVADANPDAPAYHVDTVIQFVDQQPFGATPTTTPRTSTTKPSGSDTTTPGSTIGGGSGPGTGSGSAGDSGPAQPGVFAEYAADGDFDPQHPRVRLEGRIGIHPPAGDEPGLPDAPTPAGGGPQQFAALLQAPSLLCIQGASVWQDNAQVTEACNQAAGAIAPSTSPIGGAVGPALG